MRDWKHFWAVIEYLRNEFLEEFGLNVTADNYEEWVSFAVELFEYYLREYENLIEEEVELTKLAKLNAIKRRLSEKGKNFMGNKFKYS